MSNKIYGKQEIPQQSKDDPDFSEDVITCDEGGLLNIGFYSYKENKWSFHTDTLVDYCEKGHEMEFVWMYRPTELQVKK